MSGLKLFVKLSKTEKEILAKPVTGNGGFQCLMKRLQKKVNRSGVELDPDEMTQIYKYATKHGQGGFQDRLAIFKPVVGSRQGIRDQGRPSPMHLLCKLAHRFFDIAVFKTIDIDGVDLSGQKGDGGSVAGSAFAGFLQRGDDHFICLRNLSIHIHSPFLFLFPTDK